MTTIDPTSIPVFEGDLATVAAAAARFAKAGTQVDRAGVRVHTRFQGLAGCYRAPESADLLASTVPVRTRATEFGEHLTAVGRALATYVYQMRSVASRLDAVQSEACAFVVEQMPNGEGWDKDPAAVAKNNALLATVNALVVAKAAVERDCANAINRLIGGPNWQAAGQGTGPFQYGPSVISPTLPTPWGRPTSPDLPWWRDTLRWLRTGVGAGWQTSKSFGYGFVVDGLIPTLEGMRTLSFNQVLWETAKQATGNGSGAAARDAALASMYAWRQLALTAVGVALFTTPTGAASTAALRSHPTTRGLVNEARDMALQTAKSFIAWDTWKHDPARALGTTTFNVASLILPTKGISGLGKGTGAVDDATRAASATERTAEATSRATPPRAGGPPRTPPSPDAAARVGLRDLTDPSPPPGAPATGTRATVEDLRRALPTRETVRRGVPDLDEQPARGTVRRGAPDLDGPLTRGTAHRGVPDQDGQPTPSTRDLPDPSGRPATAEAPTAQSGRPPNPDAPSGKSGRPPNVDAPSGNPRFPDDAPRSPRGSDTHMPSRPTEPPDPAPNASHTPGKEPAAQPSPVPGEKAPDTSRPGMEPGSQVHPAAGDGAPTASRAPDVEPGSRPDQVPGAQADAPRAPEGKPDPRIRPATGEGAPAGSPAPEELGGPAAHPSPGGRVSDTLSDAGQNGRPPVPTSKAALEGQPPTGSRAAVPSSRLPDLELRQPPRPVSGDPAPVHPYLPAAESRPATRSRLPEGHVRVPDGEPRPAARSRPPESHSRLPETEIRPGPGDRAPDRQRLPDQESRQLSRRGAGEGPPDRPHPPETDPQKTDDGTHHVDDLPDTPPREEPHQPHHDPDASAGDMPANPADKPTRDLTWDDVADDMPVDSSGYRLRPRDCEQVNVTPEQIHWLKTRQAPLGMTPEQYRAFRITLREALEADGVDIADVDARLQGSGAKGFSGDHKPFPRPGRRGWTPQVAERVAEWFGDDPVRPANRPFDSSRTLGLDNKLSDYDVQISSDAMVDRAHQVWLERGSAKPFIRSRYGFVERGVVKNTFLNLLEWRTRWQRTLHRQVPPAVFGSSGPPPRSRTGMSAAKRDDDWIIDLTRD